MDKQQKIKFTAIVITYNDCRYLNDCLKSLEFCEELIVFDLGSNDASIDIAKNYGAKVYHHKKTIIVEKVRKKAISYSKNDWIVFIDPDEIAPPNIGDIFHSIILENTDLGVVYLPSQFYIKDKPLTFTIWGQEKRKAFLFHKNRNVFNPYVHNVFSLIDGYKSISLPYSEKFCVNHFWINSYKQLFEKHIRYIKAEGEARYNQGQRFLWSIWAKETIYALKLNLCDYRGLLNGYIGIFLSFFYAWYINMSYLSLLRYQKKIDREISS